MKKILLLLTKIVIGIVLLVVLLLVTATILLNTQSVQDDLVAYATEQLELKLGTRVKIDHASVNVFTQKVNLEGLEVEDLEHRKMFELGRLFQEGSQAEAGKKRAEGLHAEVAYDARCQ